MDDMIEQTVDRIKIATEAPKLTSISDQLKGEDIPSWNGYYRYIYI
jgi:hypothetical protein